MKYIVLILFTLFTGLIIAAQVSAAPAAKPTSRDRSSLPITIKSNELSADNKGKIAVFSGKVIAKQGDITIYADKVTVNYGDTKGEVEQIEATGSVRIVQTNRTGVASQAIYNSREGRITLTGSPKVIQGDDTVSGKTITYFIDDDKSVVSGGGDSRVEAVIHPPARKENAGKR